MESRVSIEDITPLQAQTWLDHSVNYRQLRPKVAERIASDIRAGHWRVTGQAIVLDERGNLVDGQHRLTACVLAGQPIRTVVYRGTTDALAIDTGLKRSFIDVLNSRGVEYAAVVAAATRWQWAMERGLVGIAARSAVPTISELNVTFAAHPGLFDSSRRAAMQSLMPWGPMAFLLYHFRQADPAMAESFMQALSTGENLATGDPMLLLRKRLLEQHGRARLQIVERMALAVKVWNAWIGGTALRQLKWRAVGPCAEEFPEILAPAPQQAPQQAHVA